MRKISATFTSILAFFIGISALIYKIDADVNKLYALSPSLRIDSLSGNNFQNKEK